MRVFKRVTIFIAVLMLIINTQKVSLHAGTFNIGMKSWYANWDSAASKLLGDVMDRVMLSNLILPSGQGNFNANIEDGTGYLAGPVFGYETDDKRWSINAGIMFLNSFSQSMDMALYYQTGPPFSLTIPLNVPVDIKLDRKDYELIVGYSLNNYFKIFAGYKYETYNVKANISSISFMSFSLPVLLSNYEYESKFHILMPGASATLPVGERFRLGLKASVPIAKPEIIDKTFGQDIDVKGRFGIIGEAYASVKLWDKVIVKLGYGYETYKFKIDIDGWGISSDVAETFHGINVAGMLSF